MEAAYAWVVHLGLTYSYNIDHRRKPRSQSHVAEADFRLPPAKRPVSHFKRGLRKKAEKW